MWVTKSSVVYAKQANQTWSERAKRDSRASLAQYSQIKQTKHSLREQSELRERASQAQSSQIKQTKHSPYDWSELRGRASQSQSSQTSQSKPNQANHATNANKAKPKKQKKAAVRATEASKPGAYLSAHLQQTTTLLRILVVRMRMRTVSDWVTESVSDSLRTLLIDIQKSTKEWT